MKSYRGYYDPEMRFRIGYNFNPRGKEPIQVVVLHILKSSTPPATE